MSHLILTAIGDGGADSVRLVEDDDLDGAGLDVDELLVAIEAAPVNPAFFLMAAGRYPVRPVLPAALGAEGVGRVLRAGAGVDPSLVGRRVIVLPTYEQGTWAERVVVPARNAVPVDDAGDPLQQAMIGVNPATAWVLLHKYVELAPGDWIGQNLANSAVGQYVVALAERAGVRTLNVVRRAEAAKQVDADVVLVDGPDLADRVAGALRGERLKAVFDGVGGDAVGPLAGALGNGGTVIAYSSVTGQAPAVPVTELIGRDIRVRGLFVIDWVRTAPREELQQVYRELAALVTDGTLTATVEATYPLTGYRAALEHARRTGRTGKVLFTP